MPNNGNTEHENAAQLTANLVDHGHTPDRISDAVLEILIEMSAESRMDIRHRGTGLSVARLAALYRLYETGAGYRRSRLYGDYHDRSRHLLVELSSYHFGIGS